ncbi:hypothetical protein [Planococcus shenhongbingii]|uniref:Lipoprotein n=1 Tax=Planococcus shenhongbingii TaxID=3058398 RepID=A0ABT8NH75_9BACL|nr:hypothetical protein [Planococcus sp. N017]MDN7247243.1 hypothetical protein [Planococcus sp. N017]
MKKLLMIGFSAALLLGACSEETATEETTEEQKETEKTAQETGNAKQEFMRFYMSVSKTINATDADLNTFEINQTEGTLPEGADLQAMKDAAKASAEKTAAAVEGIEIPETLADQKKDIETALGSIEESYDMKADELTKEADFEAAIAKFAEADEKLNDLLKAQELNPSSLYTEVAK